MFANLKVTIDFSRHLALACANPFILLPYIHDVQHINVVKLCNHVSFLIIIFTSHANTWHVCICWIYLIHYFPQWNSQPSYIFETIVEFKIVVLKSNHKYFMWGITHEFKILMVEASHKYNLSYIVIEFWIIMFATNHKFHIKSIFYH
jgi:hypothetical protein